LFYSCEIIIGQNEAEVETEWTVFQLVYPQYI
jgi:hypothetical protein